MSVTNSPMPEWRKRSSSMCNETVPVPAKKPRFDYFYVLASESSLSEDERSESVDSIQGRETEYCKDTTDTDTKSEQSSDDYDVKVEYELVSTTDTEENPFADGSSSGEDALIAANAVTATIANNGSNLDIWLTDGEDDDTDTASSVNDSIQQVCKKCNIRGTVSNLPLCSYCYQIRKNCYPPRPKHRKARKGSASRSLESASGSLTTDRLSACLTGLSQDSGVGSSQSTLGSSQELQRLAWDKVVVPQNLIKSSQTVQDWKNAAQEPCVLCNERPKNGIFVHSTGGHLCCCYSCAVKSWTKTKRCAWCNLKAKNVIKAFLV